MLNNVPLLQDIRRARKTIVTVLAMDIHKAKQEKPLLEAMSKVCTFYSQEIVEIDARIKREQEELQKRIEERRLKEEQEKRRYYIQKRGRGVSIVKLSTQEKETLQNLLNALEIEHLEEIEKTEDGTDASPSWWGDVQF